MALHWRTTKANFPDDDGPSLEDCIQASTGMDGETYLRNMKVDAGSKISRSQWGGFLEASVMATKLSCKLIILQKEHSQDGKVKFKRFITYENKNSAPVRGTIVLSYTGLHYSALKVDPSIMLNL